MTRLLIALWLAVSPATAAVVKTSPAGLSSRPGAAAGAAGASLSGRTGGALGLSKISLAGSITRPAPTVLPAAAAGTLATAAAAHGSESPAAVAQVLAPAARAAARLGLRHDGQPSGKDESPLAAAFAPVPKELLAPPSGASPADGKAAANADWAKRLGEIGRPLNILVAASEAVPLIKTGGLADVVDDTTRGLARRGHRVLLLVPKHAEIDAAGAGFRQLPAQVAVPVGGRMEAADLWHARREGVDVVLTEHEEYFGRLGPYGHKGYDYSDNDARYGFFARVALEASRRLGFKPHVVHGHDWQTALLPVYLKLVYGRDPFFAAARSVLTIHNVAFTGTFAAEALARAGFDWGDFTYDRLEHHGAFSFLKAGAQFADALTTVSPTYARQIQEERYGYGLWSLLRYRAPALHGILNGIDPELNDPGKDPQLARGFGIADAAEGKAANKVALQERLGLDRDPAAPLFTVAARLTDQKGIDLILEALPFLVEQGAQLAVLGSGDREFEQRLDEAAKRYPGRVFRHPFDTVLVRLLYAAGDFLLMPSLFEPCGLSQMFAHRYGGLVLATRTGGLADSVSDLRADPARGNGYFLAEPTGDALKAVIVAALALFRDPVRLAAARRSAMETDHSWDSSLDLYESLYRSLLK